MKRRKRETAMTEDETNAGTKARHTRIQRPLRGRSPLAPRLAALAALALSAGCAGTADEPSTTGTPAAPERSTAVSLSEPAQRIYERTLVRDGLPPCAELTEGVEAPSAALVEITERVTAPPGSGIRAAECLLEAHALEVEPTLTSWVTHEATLGFGLLVLGRLDALEPALAERLARAALAGELAERARPRIARSERLHGLVEPDAAAGTAPR
jgi:hypothetical protein